MGRFGVRAQWITGAGLASRDASARHARRRFCHAICTAKRASFVVSPLGARRRVRKWLCRVSQRHAACMGWSRDACADFVATTPDTAREASARALAKRYGGVPTRIGGEQLILARIAILYAAEDERWRDEAMAALVAFTHALTPLRAGSVIDPGFPVLVIWTAHAARRPAQARAILRSCDDIIVWRPDGALTPAWLSAAVPVGPEMPARTLALMAKFVAAEAERRTRAPSSRRRSRGKLALAACAGASVLVAMAGAAMFHGSGAPERIHAVRSPPLEDLRGLQ